ncbi:potassium-transporting ATPase subunit KdpC [soil metagenome]
MLKEIVKECRPAMVLLAAFTLITGVIYPVAVTAVGGAVFSSKAGGSLINRDGNVVGSSLIAQKFTGERYFWARPSAADYNAASSSGSNLAPSNPALADAVKARVADMRTSDSLNHAPIPPDLALTSASGLDPDISIDGANWQAARVARVRGIPEVRIRELVEANTHRRALGVLGEPAVNVLVLNIALDDLAKK